MSISQNQIQQSAAHAAKATLVATYTNKLKTVDRLLATVFTVGNSPAEYNMHFDFSRSVEKKAREALTSGVRAQIERIAATITDTPSAQARRDATGAWATMVGAMIMARALDHDALSDQILQDARDWIEVRLQGRGV